MLPRPIAESPVYAGEQGGAAGPPGHPGGGGGAGEAGLWGQILFCYLCLHSFDYTYYYSCVFV